MRRGLDPDNPEYTFALGFPVDSWYRHWIREHLRTKDFFTRIESGLGGLPDIREAVLPLQRPIEELYYPRSLKAMLPHLVRNLEWYMDPIRRPKTPATIAVYSFAIGFNLLAGGINLYSSIQSARQHGILIGCLNLTCAIWIALRGSLCVGEARGSEKYRINAAELYRYLVELHTDESEAQATSV